MEERTTNIQDLEALSLDILTLSRNTLLVHLRFLEPAIYHLPFCAEPETTLSTDGFFIYYGFLHILKSYQIQKELVNRNLLHTILHCIFHHPFVGSSIDSVRWDLSCDIAVEAAIDELDLPYLSCGRCQGQADILKTLQDNLPILTAEKLYRYFGDADIPFEQLLTMREAFMADEHNPWYEHSSSPSQDKSSSNSSEDSENSNPSEYAGDEEQHLPDSDSTNESTDDTSSTSEDSVEQQMLSRYQDSKNKEQEEEWNDISDQIQTDLETFSRKYGKKAGLLLANIKSFHKKTFDYSDFLRQFAVLGEESKLNPDEFDYIYYTYGLHLYETVPLIEPLEYRETKKIKQFVIAIDTSASVRGELVELFLQKTYEILKQEESFFEDIILYILQCDVQIQESTKITNTKELDDYVNSMQLHGFGGTDFRPVFDHIKRLCESGELTDLKGLLYFTDGYGEYPRECPDYPTAFIFVESDTPASESSDSELEDIKVPTWAIKVILNENSLSERKREYEY